MPVWTDAGWVHRCMWNLRTQGHSLIHATWPANWSETWPPSEEDPPPVRSGGSARVPRREQLEELVRHSTFEMARRQKEILYSVAELALIPRRELAIFLGRGARDSLSKSSMSEVMSKLVNDHGVLEEIGGRGFHDVWPVRNRHSIPACREPPSSQSS